MWDFLLEHGRWISGGIGLVILAVAWKPLNRWFAENESGGAPSPPLEGGEARTRLAKKLIKALVEAKQAEVTEDFSAQQLLKEFRNDSAFNGMVEMLEGLSPTERKQVLDAGSESESEIAHAVVSALESQLN